MQLINFQKHILEKACRDHTMVFVVAGRPYHADPLIHQKTGQILSDLGVDVLTDDVFRGESDEAGYRDLDMVSQWSYPNRVIQTALQVARLPRNVQMIQLNSFGCGPDAFLMDEVSEILKQSGKNLTVIRIDEIASAGSVRLRLRSLVESLKVAPASAASHEKMYAGYTASFEKEDKGKTVIVPWFTDFISPLLPALGRLAGYELVNLPPSDRLSAETGLKYGNNEVCYPSTLILGDIIKALQSGEYDLNHTAAAITQTGGQCRATNYIAQIKTGLMRAGFDRVPVVAVAMGQSYQTKQSGFDLPWGKLMFPIINAVLFGDALYQMYNAVTVREKTQGEAQRSFDFYMKCAHDLIIQKQSGRLPHLLKQAVADFNMIPVHRRELTKIGLVGEIFVKYNHHAQAYISQWLRERNMEVVTPPILDFAMQYFVNSQVNHACGIASMSLVERMLQPAFLNRVNSRIRATEKVLRNFSFYTPSHSIFEKAQCAAEILHLSNQFGEGWMIAAEVATYAQCGVNKVVCVQPFGCIANHIVAKGIEKRLKQCHPTMDILYLDIDSGVAEVNLQNRLHFMIGT